MKKIIMFICLVGMNLFIHGMEQNKYNVKKLEDGDKERIEFGLIREEEDDAYFIRIQETYRAKELEKLEKESNRVVLYTDKVIKADVAQYFVIDRYLKTYKWITPQERSCGEKYSDEMRRRIVFGRILSGHLVMNSDGHLIESTVKEKS